MARIFVFMSLLCAALSFNTIAGTWYVYQKDFGTNTGYGHNITFHYPNPIDWNQTCTAKYSGTDKEGNSQSGTVIQLNSSQCGAQFQGEEGTTYFVKIKYALKRTVSCPAGERPQSYTDDDCRPYEEIQCGENQTIDPVTGMCTCSDGSTENANDYSCSVDNTDPDNPDNGDGSGGDGSGGDGSGGDGSDFDCNTSESCLSEAQLICETGNRSLMEYQYLGSGYYDYQCGYQDYDCGEGFSWDRANQVCKADQDQDGTPDDQDPEPENPDETGDRDGDGVPDGQDSHPDDPDQWNGNPQSNHNGQNVNPIGESETFNDSAIVEALNQNTQTTNTTNTKLDSLFQQGAITNDALGSINQGLQGISDALGESEPTGKGSDDLNDSVGQALDDFEQMTIDEFNKGIDDNLLVEKGDFPTIETAFGGLELEKCEDITNQLFTLELCSLAPRINPILYWAFACFTVIACFQNVSATLKKENR